MKKYKYIFIVLVYKNTADLIDFFAHLDIEESHVLVVNSYYDDATEEQFKKIAAENNADFLSVENRGYGFGNNCGIEYALNNYDFDFLIISNADITVRKLNPATISKTKVTAPKILTLRGKNQNPSSPFSPSKLLDNLLLKTYEGNHNKLIWAFWTYSRFTKILYYCISGIRKKVFSPHGAFIIIPKHILSTCIPLFNEKMFLFNEESHLGRLLKKNGFEVEYNPEIVIDHKEDGSVSLLNASIFNLQKESFLELYKYWYRKNHNGLSK